MDQYPQSPYQYNQIAPYSDQDRRWQRWVAWLLIAAAVITAGVIVFSAIRTRQNTGILQLQTASDAVISAGQTGVVTKKIGTGNIAARLRPGKYQVTAQTSKGATSRIVTIQKQQTTRVDLTIAGGVDMPAVAQYTAQSILPATDNSLYFLNLLEGVLYNYPLGASAGRPYMTAVNDIASLQWINPSQFIMEDSEGDWQYVHDGQTATIALNEDATPTNVSVNRQGQMAFVASDKQVAIAGSPAATPQSIATVKTDNAAVSIAPNGDVLLYTPLRNYGDATERTRLYHGGQFTDLPEQLTGIANVAWNTDSSAFSYTSHDGLFVYDLGTQTVHQVLADTPTDPNSGLWVSATSLVYAHNGAIWKYDGQEQSAQLGTIQGTLPDKQPLSLSADGTMVYFSTTAQDNKGGRIYSFAPNFHALSPAQRAAVEEAQKQSRQQSINFTGIDTLISYGASTDQAESLKYAFGRYASASRTTIHDIVLTDMNIVVNPGATDFLTFNVIVDGQTHLQARMDLTNITSMRLYLYDQGGRQLFDSQAITAQ